MTSRTSEPGSISFSTPTLAAAWPEGCTLSGEAWERLEDRLLAAYRSGDRDRLLKVLADREQYAAEVFRVYRGNVMSRQAKRKEGRLTEFLLWELDAGRLWRELYRQLPAELAYDRGFLGLVLGAQEVHAGHHRAAFVDALAEVEEYVRLWEQSSGGKDV